MPKSISELAGRRGDPSLDLSCLQISFWSNLSFAPSQDLRFEHGAVDVRKLYVRD